MMTEIPHAYYDSTHSTHTTEVASDLNCKRCKMQYLCVLCVGRLFSTVRGPPGLRRRYHVTVTVSQLCCLLAPILLKVLEFTSTADIYLSLHVGDTSTLTQQANQSWFYAFYAFYAWWIRSWLRSIYFSNIF
jgi:hypothetical protein